MSLFSGRPGGIGLQTRVLSGFDSPRLQFLGHRGVDGYRSKSTPDPFSALHLGPQSAQEKPCDGSLLMHSGVDLPAVSWCALPPRPAPTGAGRRTRQAFLGRDRDQTPYRGLACLHFVRDTLGWSIVGSCSPRGTHLASDSRDLPLETLAVAGRSPRRGSSGTQSEAFRCAQGDFEPD